MSFWQLNQIDIIAHIDYDLFFCCFARMMNAYDTVINRQSFTNLYEIYNDLPYNNPKRVEIYNFLKKMKCQVLIPKCLLIQPVIKNIGQYLTIEEYFRSKRVCKIWNKTLTLNNLPLMDTFILSKCVKMSTELIIGILKAQREHITILDLAPPKLTSTFDKKIIWEFVRHDFKFPKLVNFSCICTLPDKNFFKNFIITHSKTLIILDIWDFLWQEYDSDVSFPNLEKLKNLTCVEQINMQKLRKMIPKLNKVKEVLGLLISNEIIAELNQLKTFVRKNKKKRTYKKFLIRDN